MEMGFSLMTSFQFLSLDCATKLTMGGIVVKHVEHVVKANEGVINGNNIHFSRIESSPGDLYSQIYLLIPSPSCLRDLACTAQEDAADCWAGRNREPNDFNYFSPSPTTLNGLISYHISLFSFIYPFIHLFINSMIIESYCMFDTM